MNRTRTKTFFPRTLAALVFTGNVYAADDAPSLPEGLGDLTRAVVEAVDAAVLSVAPDTWLFSGFWDTRAGSRLQSDPLHERASIAETRVQLRLERPGERLRIQFAADVLYDDLQPEGERDRVDLDRNRGWLDLREAALAWRVGDAVDLKAGRQILTWGVGDLLFINDLFPKDYQAFFVGRDLDYLKAPSNALRLSIFNDALNLDLVYTPRFAPDRYLDGTRLSFLNAATGTRVGAANPIATDVPDAAFDDDEFALRAYRTVGSAELAAYAYRGYWKSPASFDPGSGRFGFPRLAVYGASVRAPLAGGIASAEIGGYDSRDDRDGDDPLVRNGESRVLLGYEREIASELTLGVQFYVERLHDYRAYLAALPPGAAPLDRQREVWTVRLTQLALNQKLRASLFVMASPTDQDGYIRPTLNYRVDDRWTVELGGNVFVGDSRESFFGQLEDNSNVYLGVRRHFD